MTVESVVGLQEIAEMLEVNRRTPHAWQYRRLLPPPDYNSINGLKAWDRTTIIEWAARTGRLPETLRSEVKGDVTIPRGGRQAKAENLAALVAAGLLPNEAEQTDEQPEPTQPEERTGNEPPARAHIGSTW
jgi:hypothetical protein